MFVATLTVSSNGESVARGVLITPRYSVTAGPEYFRPLTNCDTSVENETEWHITQDVHQGDWNSGPLVSSKHWDFDRVTLDGPYWQALPGSELSYETTMAGPVMLESFDAAEIDLIIDDLLVVPIETIGPSGGSRNIDEHLSGFFND